MRHERFLEPVSEADPCGPDLDEIGDNDYINYFIPAESRIPEQFFSSSDAKQIDTEKVLLSKELESIDELLERSRDLRLLTLEARMQSFFGQMTGFVDCLMAIAGLLELYWDDVHPRAMDGDYTLRRNTLESLDDLRQVIIPLQHLPLLRDNRIGNITMRQYFVATGVVAPREEEKAGDAGTILMRLGAEENRAAAEAIDHMLAAGIDALKRIAALFVEKSGYSDEPDFTRLVRFFVQAKQMVEAARPDLGGGEGAEAETGASDGAAGATEGGATAAAAGPAAAVKIASHAEAREALGAARSYFLAREPSSPALIIVQQAHTLIGRPLTEALDALLPYAADQAMIRFDAAMQFQIAMPNMRSLVEAIGAGEEEAAVDKVFTVATRGEASAVMSGVEAFLRATEPSSPVPMLLAKARGWLNRDFAMILNELMPKPDA